MALVSCVKSKKPLPAPARDLYASTLFKLMRTYVEATADEWYILSAAYGLVRPDQLLEPYEKTLNRMRKPERKLWAEDVLHRLRGVLPKTAEVTILAGQKYREDLVPFLRNNGYEVVVPLHGLSFGKQLQRLKQMTSEL